MTDEKKQKVDEISADVLEAMPYAYSGKRDIVITIKQPEFTSVCPMTGLPDYGCIIIKYCPAEDIIELKSLKYYFLQYRNYGIFYEHLVNVILNDLVSVLKPMWMEVTGDFSPRGGISTVVSARYDKPAITQNNLS